MLFPRRRRAADILLVLVTVCAYLPALQNGFIWDDDYYVTENTALRSVEGLGRIWFELGAVPQYYPMTHTTFWVEYHLWGLHPLGYHLVNVLLHALVALLWSRVLMRLGMSEIAAMFAALLFAVHPVHVESVAWITERKNVLSGALYLGAALCYLRATDADAPVNRRMYTASLVLFIMALLSKSVTATLPCALLLVAWWQRGRWCRRDLLTLPMFALGFAMGLVTVYMERHHVGAAGDEWSLTAIERVLLAGRALWFYAGKLAWPDPLVFVYPRWSIDQAQAWQYLYPAAAVAVIVALWALRRRIGRGPLVGVLFFAGTLFPALGFFDVFPFRYSFVADHFQYLASMGLIALVAAGVAQLQQRRQPLGLVMLAWVIALSVVTFRQSPVYRDLETLWRNTIADNPRAWMAYNNLGSVLNDRGDHDDAIEMFRRALALRPHHHDARYNLGLAYDGKGEHEAALETYRAVLIDKPDHIRAANALTHSLISLDRLDEAELASQRAFDMKPAGRHLAEALHNLALIRLKQARADEAVQLLEQAVPLDPTSGALRHVYGSVLLQQGRNDEALLALVQAVKLAPDLAPAHRDLGMALARQGDLYAAEPQFAEAARLNPDDASTWSNLGVARLALGNAAGAVEAMERALTLEPNRAATARSLAWILATHPDDAVRNGDEAVRLATHAVMLTQRGDALTLDALAAAYAEVGKYGDAAATATLAAHVARQSERNDLAAAIDRRIDLYSTQKPFRDVKR